MQSGRARVGSWESLAVGLTSFDTEDMLTLTWRSVSRATATCSSSCRKDSFLSKFACFSAFWRCVISSRAFACDKWQPTCLYL